MSFVYNPRFFQVILLDVDNNVIINNVTYSYGDGKVFNLGVINENSTLNYKIILVSYNEA